MYLNICLDEDAQRASARLDDYLERYYGQPAAVVRKRQAGYALTPLGSELIARAEQVELAANGFADAAAAQSRNLSGTVKITTEEVYAITLLAPLLRELHETHPEIQLELDTSQIVRDLGGGNLSASSVIGGCAER